MSARLNIYPGETEVFFFFYWAIISKKKNVQKLFKVRVILRSEFRARQFWLIEFVRANSGLYGDFSEILFFPKNFFCSKVLAIFR